MFFNLCHSLSIYRKSLKNSLESTFNKTCKQKKNILIYFCFTSNLFLDSSKIYE